MKLSDEQKRMLLGALLTAILVVVFQAFVAFGIPIVVPPVPDQPLGATARTAIICNGGETNCVDARYGKDIVVYSDNASTTKFSVDGATGNTVIAGTLTLGGYAQSGAVRYGTAATYTSGTSITHGFSVTPTVCLINPNQNITSTYTITATGFSSNMQTTANPIYWMCGK